MPDRNRVIDGLRKAAEELATYAPMKVNGRCQAYFNMAIYMLKEQNSCENCAVAIEDRQLVVHCKDCKWYDEQISMCDNCRLSREQTFFCADGERR